MEQRIKKYGPRLFGLCMTLCKDAQDAWDLYQDTWLRAYERQMQYRADMPYEGWLTSICVNRYRDIMRRRKLAPFLDVFATTEDKERILESIPTEEVKDYRDVRDAVDHLPARYREAVILYYFEDKDVRRTAETLKIPEGTVKSRLKKARELLKEVLTDEWNL